MAYLTLDEWLFTLLLIGIVFGVGLMPKLASAVIRATHDDPQQ